MIDAAILKTDDFLRELDECLLLGFANLTPVQRATLNKLASVYAGTPLADALQTSVESLQKGMFQPEYFRVIAAARAALQGAQYDHLRRALHTQLGRAVFEAEAYQPAELIPAVPLLDGTAHWLADIAIQGFARMETGTLSAFDSTLSQLQADPLMLSIAALLTGFLDDLIGAVPVKEPAGVPLFRWVDLWSRAFLLTAHQPMLPQSQTVSGNLYLMGLEWRSQQRLMSVVFYGILEGDNGAQWVRITFSAYKVDAIQRDEAWLLIPETETLLNALRDGTTLQLDQMQLLETGDLLWDAACVTPGPAYKLAEIAQAYLVPNAPEPLYIPAIQAAKRHPLHLAEPIALLDYSLSGADFIKAGDWRLQVDARRVHNTEIDLKNLDKFQQMLALLRYDNQQFWVQPLVVVGKGQKKAFIGLDETLKLFKKPPKNNTVEILQERASKLLREAPKRGTNS